VPPKLQTASRTKKRVVETTTPESLVGPKTKLVATPGKLQNLFSGNVRMVRQSIGLSQEALAHEAGLDRTYISSIERNLRNVSIGNIERIAQALQVDPRDLLDPKLSVEKLAARRSGSNVAPFGVYDASFGTTAATF